jgi:D-amino-acid dehydrogenase
MKSCVVIGGGAVGLCSAYYLAKAGHRVVVLDSSDMSDGCSYGNSGMVVPSHIIPLAHPGVVSRGMKWMFSSKSPFYVKPRLSRELFSWGHAFYKNSNTAHVERSMPALRDLSAFSKELYQELARESDSFLYEEKGLLLLFRTERAGEEERHDGLLARKHGLKVDFLSKDEVSALETGIKTDCMGGVYYRGDAHLAPDLFMQFLKQELKKLGVALHKNEQVLSFTSNGNKIASVHTDKQQYSADEVVLCAGAWSPKLAKMLGVKIRILPGKGYSFTVPAGGQAPTVPSVLCEGKVAVTPMGSDVRFGGTMEITHTGDHKIRERRVQGIVETANQFYPELALAQPSSDTVWHGFRPCTPTGLPLISRASGLENFIVASGHAMMGLSLAPATGKLVEELVGKKPPSVSLEQFGIR